MLAIRLHNPVHVLKAKISKEASVSLAEYAKKPQHVLASGHCPSEPFSSHTFHPYKDEAQTSLVAVARAQKLERGTALLLKHRSSKRTCISFPLNPAATHPPRPWDLAERSKSRCASHCVLLFLEGPAPIWQG